MRVKNIHAQMVRRERVEETALRKAGLRDKNFESDKVADKWRHLDAEFPVGPCAANLRYLKEKYQEEYP